MLRTLFSLLVLLASAPATALDADAFAEVLAPIRAEYDLPALAAALVTVESEIPLVSATGMRHRDGDVPVTTDDLWHLGSCTKAMTATLAARLVEAGVIDWQTRVGEVFGEAAAEGFDRRLREVTLTELLAHRAGLPRHPPEVAVWLEDLAGASLPEQRKQVSLRLLARPPVNLPGTTFKYSNAGYVVAASLLEQRTGQSWETLMQQQVFEPLGLDSAGFGPPGQGDPEGQPWGHDAQGAPVAPDRPDADNPSPWGPAGRVHMSLADWGRFVRAHLVRPGEYLSAVSWEILHRPFSPEYALGWGVAQRDWAGGLVLNHAGSNTLWYAVVWLAPTRGFAVLTVANVDGDPGRNGTDVAAASLIRAHLQERALQEATP